MTNARGKADSSPWLNTCSMEAHGGSLRDETDWWLRGNSCCSLINCHFRFLFSPPQDLLLRHSPHSPNHLPPWCFFGQGSHQQGWIREEKEADNNTLHVTTGWESLELDSLRESRLLVCVSQFRCRRGKHTLGIYDIDVLIFYRWCRRKSRLLCVTQSYSIPPPLYHHPPMAITLLPLVGFWCLILRTKLNWYNETE